MRLDFAWLVGMCGASLKSKMDLGCSCRFYIEFPPPYLPSVSDWGCEVERFWCIKMSGGRLSVRFYLQRCNSRRAVCHLFCIDASYFAYLFYWLSMLFKRKFEVFYQIYPSSESKKSRRGMPFGNHAKRHLISRGASSIRSVFSNSNQQKYMCVRNGQVGVTWCSEDGSFFQGGQTSALLFTVLQFYRYYFFDK